MFGRQLFDEIFHALDKCEFNDTDYCEICDEDCPTSPRAHVENRDAFWIESGGHVCCAWSTMNKHSGGLLHTSTLSMLVWLFSSRFYEADLIVEENVVKSPISVLK